MLNYAVSSIEAHLFFARIMREHALFLEAGFPCKDETWIQKAEFFREQFENLHREVIALSNGNVRECVLQSDELVTEFTIPAERRTRFLTGIPIDSDLSRAELALRCDDISHSSKAGSRTLMQQVHRINQQSIRLLNGLILFKESILREIGNGSLFNANYPLLIRHIIREAMLYRTTIQECMLGRNVSQRRLCEIESFWNRIMMEHALFIRGLLDPSEEALIDTANEFAGDYRLLLEKAEKQDATASGLCQQNRELVQESLLDCAALRRESLEETLKYRQFKTAGAEGILTNQIASLILPLLADHVLREANHYIRLLTCSQID